MLAFVIYLLYHLSHITSIVSLTGNSYLPHRDQVSASDISAAMTKECEVRAKSAGLKNLDYKVWK